MRRYRSLFGLLVAGGVVSGGCQLLSGVDTIEYVGGAGLGGGGAGSRTGSSQSTNTSASTTDGATAMVASSGSGGPCGDGACSAAESACTCAVDCAGKPGAPANGCCEPTEAATSGDCALPILCDHDTTCEAGESCSHCDDCGGCPNAGVGCAACRADCDEAFECGLSGSSSSSMGPPVCCKCGGNPVTVCEPSSYHCGYLPMMGSGSGGGTCGPK